MKENPSKAPPVLLGLLIGIALAWIAQAFFVLNPSREARKINQVSQDYLSHIKPGEYSKAYDFLSKKTKDSYTKDDFLSHHEQALWNSRESKIDEILVDAQNPEKATVKISIPHPLYNQTPVYLDLIREKSEWKIVLDPSVVAPKIASPTKKEPILPTGLKPTEPGAPTEEGVANKEGAPEAPPTDQEAGAPEEAKKNPNDPCGNGQLDEGEECDPKLPSSCTLGVCKPDCSGCDYSSCGNGVCEPDKNENINNCPPDCHPVCGNGVVEPGEECDGNACNPGRCTENCTCDSSTCGNSLCEPEYNENCTNCVFDCGECLPNEKGR